MRRDTKHHLPAALRGSLVALALGFSLLPMAHGQIPTPTHQPTANNKAAGTKAKKAAAKKAAAKATRTKAAKATTKAKAAKAVGTKAKAAKAVGTKAKAAKAVGTKAGTGKASVAKAKASKAGPTKAGAKGQPEAGGETSVGKKPPAPPRIAAPPARRAAGKVPARRPVPRKATSPKARCIGFFRGRQFRKAGECFAALGMSYGAGASLPNLRRYEKGQFLRNAAVAFEKEALLSSKVEISSWLRERAVALLQIYRNEKLCENNYRCRIALDLETRVAKKIGYVQLTVVTNHSNSLVTLLGYRFKKNFQDRASVRVRPGPYQLRIVYPKEKEPRKKTLNLSPKKPHIATFFPRIKQRGVSKLSIGLYIAAGVLIAGGGAMTGVGTAQWFQAEQEWNDPTKKRSLEPALIEQRSAAQPLIWTGASAAGVGVVLLIIGFAFHKPPPPPKAVTTPPPPRRAAAKAGAWLRLD